MTTTTHPAVAAYVTGIEAALADLPKTEVEEIVEDIRQHLAEVAGELGEEVSVEALTGRLGTPEQYASELRAAAGYPPAEPAAGHPRERRFVARLALWSLILGTALALLIGLAHAPQRNGSPAGLIVLLAPLLALAAILIFTRATSVRAIADLPEARAFTSAGRHMIARLPDGAAGYLRSLRPAWWLVRVVVLVLAMLFALRDTVNDGLGLLPLLMLIALLGFGGKERTDRRWRWIVTPANAFTVGLGIALLSWMLSTSGGGTANPSVVGPQDQIMVDGRMINNIYVFGPDGKPVPEAYLYDQNGQPITSWGQRCVAAPQESNKFPQSRVEYDATGCHEVTGVPFMPMIPPPSK